MAKDSKELATRLAAAPVAKKAAHGNIQEFFESRRSQIAQVLPAHVSVDKLLRVVFLELGKNPALAKCSIQSLYSSVLEAAQTGLEIGSTMQESWLVPSKNRKRDANGQDTWVEEAVLRIGYQGKLKLIYQSKQVAYVNAFPVYEGEDVEIDLAAGTVNHKYDFSVKRETGKILGFYAIAKSPSGQTWVEPMSKSEVDAVRDRSKAAAKGFSPWSTDFAEMGRKTVLHRLAKRLPKSVDKSVEVAAKIEHRDESLDFGIEVEAEQVPAGGEAQPEVNWDEVAEESNRRLELMRQAEELKGQGE